MRYELLNSAFGAQHGGGGLEEWLGLCFASRQRLLIALSMHLQCKPTELPTLCDVKCPKKPFPVMWRRPVGPSTKIRHHQAPPLTQMLPSDGASPKPVARHGQMFRESIPIPMPALGKCWAGISAPSNASVRRRLIMGIWLFATTTTSATTAYHRSILRRL
jgi:hypothetical protein